MRQSYVFRFFIGCFLALPAVASAQSIWKDPKQTPEARALDLLKQLTLEEKISQTLNNSPGIPRLGIQPYEWWNEALHGVARAGKATVFPQTIGMAASFDTAAVYQTFTMVSDEARAKHHAFVKDGQYKRYEGLTFWTPNINIFRDPRWGRGMETYGEDPFLTSRMGIAVVKGLQGDENSLYDKVHACAKHYAVHSGPEAIRHNFDAKHISQRDLWETYLPAFKALVQEAHVKEVMCAYNRFEGEPCCSSKELLVQILREQWGYKDVIVSDCGAIDDFFRKNAHETHPDAAAASADAVISGTDLVCGNTYNSLTDAVKKGLISEAQIDTSVLRLLRARFELGMFDDDKLVSWSAIPYSVVESPAHVAQALKMARESIVLLKNAGQTLPLRKTMKIAVVGPNANDSVMQWANYNGIPSSTVTILKGIQSKVPQARVVYEQGCDLVRDSLFKSRMNELSMGGKPGFSGNFYNRSDFSGAVVAHVQAPSALRYDIGGNTAFAPGVNLTQFSAQFESVLKPRSSDPILFRIKADDGFKLFIDGREVLSYLRSGSLKTLEYIYQPIVGKTVKIRLDYQQLEGGATLQFDMGSVYAVNPAATASRVKDADVIVFVGGMSPAVEGEEMNVDLPGFYKGDRTRLELPDVQLKMLKALKSTGKPVVLVLCSGSSVSIPWESKNLDAIVEAWYPGEQGGRAIADVLFGDYNPAGRLPLTFYRATNDLPAFEDYDMEKGRTYRYFKGTPLYPFGHGLSYTKFGYLGAKLSRPATVADSTHFLVALQNTGKVAGDEVVQVYIVNKQDPAGPARSLRGFTRVHLKAGERGSADIRLMPASFEFFNPDSGKMEVRPGEYDILYGGSSDLKDLKKLTVKIQ